MVYCRNVLCVIGKQDFRFNTIRFAYCRMPIYNIAALSLSFSSIKSSQSSNKCVLSKCSLEKNDFFYSKIMNRYPFDADGLMEDFEKSLEIQLEKSEYSEKIDFLIKTTRVFSNIEISNAIREFCSHLPAEKKYSDRFLKASFVTQLIKLQMNMDLVNFNQLRQDLSNDSFFFDLAVFNRELLEKMDMYVIIAKHLKSLLKDNSIYSPIVLELSEFLNDSTPGNLMKVVDEMRKFNK